MIVASGEANRPRPPRWGARLRASGVAHSPTPVPGRPIAIVPIPACSATPRIGGVRWSLRHA